ncbi:MAG: class I SAM-dependent methyltransferase [Methylococcaceae bacterium]
MLSPSFWKKYFEVYDYLNELIPYQELLDTICTEARIKNDDRVLDVGSGTGNLSVRLERVGAIVVGIDYSAEGLELHHQKSPASELILVDVSKPLPFPDSSFDVVVSNNVLYAISRNKRAGVFREMYRVLKPCGRIVVSNIIEGFSPSSIYLGHISAYWRTHGIIKTLVKVFGLIIPTIKIFYYNARIRLEHHHGAYDFFQAGEQAQALVDAEFKNVSGDIFAYNKQAILNSAIK